MGSWTITGGGGAPTGITLDPAAPSDLWIVDNNTDRVYQYSNAVGRTSGSLAASTSFALAAGNTNPQGIADPPPSSGVTEALAAGCDLADGFDQLRPCRWQYESARYRRSAADLGQHRQGPSAGRDFAGGFDQLCPGRRQYESARYRRSAALERRRQGR